MPVNGNNSWGSINMRGWLLVQSEYLISYCRAKKEQENLKELLILIDILSLEVEQDLTHFHNDDINRKCYAVYAADDCEPTQYNRYYAGTF